MIDERKLIEELNRLESIVNFYRDDTRQVCLNMICEIKDFVNEQPKVGEWISCNERFPKESGMYIATTKTQANPSNEPFYMVIAAEYWASEKMFVDIFNYLELTNVISWIPLPEPYKGDE